MGLLTSLQMISLQKVKTPMSCEHKLTSFISSKYNITCGMINYISIIMYMNVPTL